MGLTALRLSIPALAAGQLHNKLVQYAPHSGVIFLGGVATRVNSQPHHLKKQNLHSFEWRLN